MILLNERNYCFDIENVGLTKKLRIQFRTL
jgi:hypothetical protein